MNYPIFFLPLLTLLTLANFKICSMESISKIGNHQKFLCHEYAINEILDEIIIELKEQLINEEKVDKIIKQICDTTPLLINRILKDVSCASELEYYFYDKLSLYHKNKDIAAEYKFDLIFSILCNICKRNIQFLTEKSLNYAATNYQEHLENFFPCLLHSIVFDDFDLFDEWLLLAKENRLKEFNQSFIEQKYYDRNLERLAINVMNQNSANDFCHILEQNYNDLIRLNIVNKFSLDYTPLTFLIVALVFDERANKDLCKSLIFKIINEPALNVVTLKDAITLFNEDSFKDIMQYNGSDEQIINQKMLAVYCLNLITEKINFLRESLFNAVKNQDINLTKRIAYSLRQLTDDFKNNKGNTPMHEAIFSKNKELILGLLSIYPELIAIANNDGSTPVSLAAGDKEMLSLILDIAYIL